MRFHYCSRDGQSQTGAAYPTTTRLVSTIETIEDVGKICGMDADPVINDRDGQRPVAFQPRPEHDTSVGLGAMYGVVEDVSQCLADTHPVEDHLREVSGYLQRQFNLSSLRLWLPAGPPLR